MFKAAVNAALNTRLCFADGACNSLAWADENTLSPRADCFAVNECGEALRAVLASRHLACSCIRITFTILRPQSQKRIPARAPYQLVVGWNNGVTSQSQHWRCSLGGKYGSVMTWTVIMSCGAHPGMDNITAAHVRTCIESTLNISLWASACLSKWGACYLLIKTQTL